MNFTTGIPIAMLIKDSRVGKPQSIERVVKRIEELGYWGISVPHHVLHYGLGIIGHADAETPGWRYPEPITLLAYLAAVSTNLRLIPRVVVMPYTQPFSVAHAMATVDCLSGGRLVFSPGVARAPTSRHAEG